MKYLPLLPAFFGIMSSPWAAARPTPPPPHPVWTAFNDNRELGIHFTPDSRRRYRVDVSGDLAAWEEHYLSPFKEKGAGLLVRQVGEYAPAAEFYKVSVLPWLFQPVDVSGDWTGDVSMARLPDGRAAFVYQNRKTNELFYGVRPVVDGAPVVTERVAGTGVEDYPSWWDNSGYTDVTLQVDVVGVPHIVCMDSHAEELVLLRKPEGGEPWERWIIHSGFETPFWVFAKAAISPQGLLAVVYRKSDGSYVATAETGTPAPVWQHRKISMAQPNNARQTGIVFNVAGDLFVQAQNHFRIDAVNGEISIFPGHGQLQCHRGADGSLFQLSLGTDGTSIHRSRDEGSTWEDDHAGHMAWGNGSEASVDSDTDGKPSLMRAPALYRRLAPEGPWQRTVLRGAGLHLTDNAGKIQMILTEYDDDVSLVTED